MQFFLNLFSKIGLFVFFLFLEVIAVFFLYQKSNFHKNAIGVKATAINGAIDNKISGVIHYFALPKENKRLLLENTRLKNLLQKEPVLINDSTQTKPIEVVIDSAFTQRYKYSYATVIENEVRKKDNYFLIDKGTKDGIKPDMAVTTPNGIVGTIINVSDKYAFGISVLHSKTRVKAKIKGNDYYGILAWHFDNHQEMLLTEIPKYLPAKKGDTILTAGASDVYPAGIPLGKIKELMPNEQTGNYDITIELFEDLASVRNVYIIENLDHLEIQKLKSIKNDISNP